MSDQLRAKLVSGFVLVIVFAAGGLVGAALVGPSEGGATPTGDMAAAAEPSDTAAGGGEAESRGERRSRRSWFESAGATPEQIEYIQSEVLPAHFDRLEALEDDSVVTALESRLDTIGRAWRSAHRELSAYYDPKRDSLMDLTRSQIRAVLDPEAQQVYDSIWNANRSERDEDRDRNQNRRR